MQTFNIRDLSQHTRELVRDAEAGNLSVVTNHGRPVFVALPMSQHLLETGVFEALALKLYTDGVLSLSRAADVAGQPVERFLESLASEGIDAVSYAPEDLDDEMTSFG
jgi:prevent-host-death family protein